ncbi:ATP-binding protein [Cryobacterium sp. SO1]|uniref:ATP-binding protein n=1 Tax=Cryobacterium sp. SO1 TaxID=1897061 RepID=UPI001023BF37
MSDEVDGTPADRISHTFERFYGVDASGDRAHGGSGVGLAIAKSSTEAHGGSIRAESADAGQCATFTVELPLSAINAEVWCTAIARRKVLMYKSAFGCR